MSEASARALRRDLRRVAGADAVAVLDSHTGHIQGLGALTNANTERINDFDRKFKADDLTREEIAAALATRFLAEQHAREAIDRRLTAFESQRLIGRLRWALFGIPKSRPLTPVPA